MLNKSINIIGVACGGYGSERDISLKSGALVLETLKKSGWNAFLLVINVENSTHLFINSINQFFF